LSAKVGPCRAGAAKPEPRRDDERTSNDVEALMASMIVEQAAQVRVRRHSDVPDCDVIVVFRGREISLRCRNYKQAVEWARIECKSYKIVGGFTVES
jgi:hypothetical protein